MGKTKEKSTRPNTPPLHHSIIPTLHYSITPSLHFASGK